MKFRQTVVFTRTWCNLQVTPYDSTIQPKNMFETLIYTS